jgi:hypothetical protein
MLQRILILDVIVNKKIFFVAKKSFRVVVVCSTILVDPGLDYFLHDLGYTRDILRSRDYLDTDTHLYAYAQTHRAAVPEIGTGIRLQLLVFFKLDRI